jgi:hypothetical protein
MRLDVIDDSMRSDTFRAMVTDGSHDVQPLLRVHRPSASVFLALFGATHTGSDDVVRRAVPWAAAATLVGGRRSAAPTAREGAGGVAGGRSAAFGRIRLEQ